MSLPNFYGIIPATVRYCDGLMPNAKLLYCEITALCTEKGHCWASNAYFAKLYSVSEFTVSRWISQLQQYGFLSVVIDKTAGNQRLIYIKEAAPLLTKSARGIDEKRKTLLRKSARPIDEKRKQSITESNTISITVSSDDARAEKQSGRSRSKKNVEQKEPPVAAAPFFSESPQPKPTLFSQSSWASASHTDWNTSFLEACSIPDIDTHWYFCRCRDWSAEKGGKSLDWIATARKFALDDQRKNKLVTIQSASSYDNSTNSATNSANRPTSNGSATDRAAEERASILRIAKNVIDRREARRNRFAEH